MSVPKTTRPSELRTNLYRTLARVAEKGEVRIVPTKCGEVLLLARRDYEELRREAEYAQEFKKPPRESELVELEALLAQLAAKHGFGYENKVFKKRRQRSR